MMTVRMADRLKHLVLLTVLAFTGSSAVNAQDWIEQFETQLDFTIRSSCHGNMVDAIPDFLSEARDWLNDNTPFCQTVRTLPEKESAAVLLQQELRQKKGANYEIKRDPKFVSRMQQYYKQQQQLDFECRDWMCQHVRTRVAGDGNPISLEDYKKVAAHCGESYGCIESWFERWPRALPSNKVQLSLDSLLETQQTIDPELSSTASAGLSLDSLMAEPQGLVDEAPKNAKNSGSADSTLTLNDVFEGREQAALGSSLKGLNQVSNQMRQSCDCSLKNSGCFTVPSEDLLSSANKIEGSRYQLCQQWQQKVAEEPDNVDATEALAGWIKKQQRKLTDYDKQVDQSKAQWRQQQRELEAQSKRAQQQRADSSFMASMSSILAQSGAVANGSLTAEQAARNAVNLAKKIEGNGKVFKRQREESIKTSVPGFLGGNGGGLNSTSVTQFACYDARQRICVDYNINNSTRAQQMKRQCGLGDNQLLDSCDRQGASCTEINSVGNQTVFSYDTAVSTVRQICAAKNGVFNNY